METNAFNEITDIPTKTSREMKGKVAVIGMGCRFPEANNLKDYWSLLKEGKCVTKELPESRANLDFWIKNTHKKHICGYFNKIDLFDPLFFGITPREAMRMDPHQRLLLEVFWEALEDAGIDVKDLAGSNTGVFIGAGAMFASSHYFMHQINNKTADIYSYTGAEPSAIANKISYIFDFRGPCFALDSACSSSLTIIDEAYMRICKGQCDVAVAGSANLILSSSITDIFQNARVLTSDGKCKAFDENADGYVRGEGAGVVILKSLEKALEDGNEIWAVISGTAINHGGRNGRGFTYPNYEAQLALLKSAYNNANLSASEVYYIEAHGTATTVGDEIELAGISGAISEGRDVGNFCKIGSVKTNMGHLEYAAGIAALIKTCLMLKNKQLVPSLHFSCFKGDIEKKNMPIKVQTSLEQWPKNKKLIAGVSSFGIGGSNSHIVLESIENFISSELLGERKQHKMKNERYIFPISSHNNNALRENAKNYLEFIENNGDVAFTDLCYSVSVRKNHLSNRLAIVCENKQDLVRKLNVFITAHDDLNVFYSSGPVKQSAELTFVFSDSTDNWLNDNNLLLFNETPYLAVLRQIDAVYKSAYGNSLQLIIEEGNLKLINSQPALSNVLFFAFQVALFFAWREKGIMATRLVGYRQGEITVGYLSGVLPLVSAIRLIQADREPDISQKSINIMASAEELNKIVHKYNDAVYISAINSPNMQEVSGIKEYIEQFSKELEKKGYFYREVKNRRKRLDSQYMNELDMLPIEETKEKQKVYSTTVNSYGRFIDYSTTYWKEKETGTINFSKRITEIIEDGCDRFIEIGNDALLSFYIYDVYQNLTSRLNREVIVRSVKKGSINESDFIEGIAELYSSGYPIDWRRIYSKGNFVKMPSYAWQRQSYWID